MRPGVRRSRLRRFRKHRNGVGAPAGAFLVGLALLVTACQQALKPNESVTASGTILKGWVEDPHAVILVEVFDHCEQSWREVQRAHVESRSAKLYGFTGYQWQAPLILASAKRPECLVRAPKSQVSLRVVERGVDLKPLPNLHKESWSCIARRAASGKLSAQMILEACAPHKELPVRLTEACDPGFVLKTQRIPLAKAGNLRKLADIPDVGQPPVMYHFEDSLLVGKGPQVFRFAPEFRNYMLFEFPGLPKAKQGGRLGPVKSAWISFFVNFNTARCDHRGDFGCGYASEDSVEDYALSLVELGTLPDPRAVPYGLQITDWVPAHSLFNAIEQSPVVGRFRMQRADVDRWYQIPLGDDALQFINRSSPGQTLMFGGRVTSIDRNAAMRREWIFVDHLVGKALGPELVPQLNLSYCAAL